MKRRKIIYSIALVLTITVSGYAQKVLKHFNVDNGLLSSEVYQVVQDHKGYIWITTDEGVSRFNGYDFKNYSAENGLPESTVLEIFEDYKKRMWFVMITNELAYIENDSLYIFSYNNDIQKRNLEGYYPLKKSFYVDSSDNVYFGIYYKNILKISPQGEIFELKPKSKDLNLITKIEDKYLFTSKKDGEMRINIENPFIEDSIHTFDSKQFSCRSIIEKFDDKYYYSDYRQLFIFDKNGTSQVVKFPQDILWISKDNNNNLWFGFHQGGAVVFEDSTFTKKKYHLLPGQSVTSILEDSEKGIWVSTLYNGVYYFSPLCYGHLDKNSGITNTPIRKIDANKNAVYFAGLGPKYYTYNQNGLTNKYVDIPDNSITCEELKLFGDSLLISFTRNGNRLIYKNQMKKLKSRSFADASVKIGDRLVLFHGRHIYDFLNPNVLPILYKSKYFQDVYDALLYNDTLIWFATNNGIMEYNTVIKKATELALSPLLRSRSNSIIRARDSVVWISTKEYGLISIYRNKVKSFKNSMFKNVSVSGLVDLDSILFVSTNNGVFRLEKIGDSLSFENAIRISSGNGLLSDDINGITSFKGLIYAASAEGVSHFPINMSFSESPIFITNISINGKDTINQSSYNLHYDENYIAFEFVGLNYQRNDQLTYLYKLEGVDKTWRESHDLKAQYSALSPGNYAFKVMAKNSSGLTSKTPATVIVKINKAYYNTIWFRVVAVFTFLLLVAGIFIIVLRIKLREARKRHLVEQELNRTRQQALSAQMNPHFIYNSLNSVQSYILKNEKVKASDYLSKLGRLMRNILNNSQNHTITLREEFDALERYMEMEQLRFKDLFTFKFDICSRIDLDKIQVPPLIIQPFVENAIHHGLRLRKETGELLVEAQIVENALQIVVQDNGVGIENAKQYNSKTRKNHKSFGTEITHKRLQLLEEMNKEKVTLSISEAYPKNEIYPGTRVVLLINLS